MSDIQEISVTRALQLRRLGLTWREIGQQLSTEFNRWPVLQGPSVFNAIKRVYGPVARWPL